MNEKETFSGLRSAAAKTGAAIVLLSDVTEPIVEKRAFQDYARAISRRTDRGVYFRCGKGMNGGQTGYYFLSQTGW